MTGLMLFSLVFAPNWGLAAAGIRRWRQRGALESASVLADLYRLERTDEIADLALEELAEFKGIVLVEWGDVVEALFGDHLDVHLDLDDDLDDADDDDFDAVISLGVLIRGGTAHFDLIAAEVAKGLAASSMETGVPMTFGVVTAETLEQAVERAGTKHGNKGWDAALAAIEMARMYHGLGGS